MAIITPLVPSIAGSALAFAASAVSGDQVTWTGSDLLIEFFNGHGSSITIDIAPTKTTGRVSGAGAVSIPTRSLVLAASAYGGFYLPRTELSAYLNASGRIPITYTSGNIALLLRALHLG